MLAPCRASTLISTACSWVNIGGQKATILAQVGPLYLGAVGQFCIGANTFPKEAKTAIQALFRRSSPWAIAKDTGKYFVPSGDPTQAFARLAQALRNIGIHVVEVGELEKFVPSVGMHGPKWVNHALKKDLKNDPELGPARDFVRRLIS